MKLFEILFIIFYCNDNNYQKYQIDFPVEQRMHTHLE